MYDELKTQNSVMETYTTKLDSKVNELEDILEAMESNLNPKSENDTNDDDPLQKLRIENDWLREVLIRATKEEVSNCKEDSIRIKPAAARDTSVFFSMKEKLAQLVQDTPPVPPLNDAVINKDNTVEDRKSLKVSHSFIKRQNSTKKMGKNKITKPESESLPPPVSHNPITATSAIHKREHSSSAVRSASRKDFTTETSQIPATNSDLKLPGLSAITENNNKHHSVAETSEKSVGTSSTTPRHTENNSIRLPRLSLSTKPTQNLEENNTAKPAPLTARFEKIHHQSSTIGPSPSHKALQRTVTVTCTASPKWHDSNNENITPSLYSSNPPSNPPPAPPPFGESKELKEVKELKEELKEVMLTPKGSKMSLNEVVQKLSDLEKRVVVKEKFAETEQTDLKRQIEDMKSSLDNLVSVINHISLKLVPT